MRLDKIQEEWGRDAEFDLSKPDGVLRDIPLLHHKYWVIYNTERERFLNYKREFDYLRRDKFDWYLGRLDEERRIARGWEPMQLRIVRTEVDNYLTTDPDLMVIREKMEQVELRLKFLEDIIKAVNFRSNLVRTYIDWLRFSKGSD